MLFIQLASNNPKFYFMWIFMVVFSVCIHEYSHAQTALWLGDRTAAERGHLTLNPMKQMGLISIITLVLFGICWGNVPVNYRNLYSKGKIALTALSGPFSNLLLFFIFCIAISIMLAKCDIPQSSPVIQFFAIGAMLNIVLLIFNLIPVPPLDGWVIIFIFVPKIFKLNQEIRNGVIFALFILLFFSFNKLFILGEYCTNHLVDMIVKVLL